MGTLFRPWLVLRDHTALFPTLVYCLGRSGSAIMIAGRCDRAIRFHYLPTWQEFETAVRSLCSQYVLISFSVCHYRASTITLLGLIHAHFTSTPRCHWDCGAHDYVQGVVPMLSIASQWIHVTIPLPLDLFNPLHCYWQSADPLRLF